MNERSAIPGLLQICILLCAGMCLLFALTPLTDFDHDGILDSFLTDGLLLAFSSCALATPVLLLVRSFFDALPPAKLLPSLVVPPPITI